MGFTAFFTTASMLAFIAMAIILARGSPVSLSCLLRPTACA